VNAALKVVAVKRLGQEHGIRLRRGQRTDIAAHENMGDVIKPQYLSHCGEPAATPKPGIDDDQAGTQLGRRGNRRLLGAGDATYLVAQLLEHFCQQFGDETMVVDHQNPVP